jgi:hypothetical protein
VTNKVHASGIGCNRISDGKDVGRQFPRRIASPVGGLRALELAALIYRVNVSAR